MFSKLVAPKVQEDGIIWMMNSVAADKRPIKVDLTVGLYKNSQGHTPLMRAVGEAEKELALTRMNKSYVLPSGDPLFMNEMRTLAFGEKSAHRFIGGVQTPGASGALGLILQTIQKAEPAARIWVSDPTYINHMPTIKSVGLKSGTYPFLNPETMGFLEDQFFSWLKTLTQTDVVVFHGSCHNPSGLMMPRHAWVEIAAAAERQGFLPLFDTAYQGLGDGVTEDREGLELVLERVERLALSISCSKSFSLYSDRVGCAFIVGNSKEEAENAVTFLSSYSRSTYWVPPNNGAQIVAKVLSNTHLRIDWENELANIRARLQRLRESFVLALQKHTQCSRFDYIGSNSGMFSMLPASPKQMQRLREEFAIYGLTDGRINIAALNEDKIEYVSECLAKVF